MVRTTLLVIAGAICISSTAQKYDPELKIGQPFPGQPALRIEYGDTNVKFLSDFYGRPLIIELFSSSCLACFKVMPKMDSLQREFKGKVNVLLVGLEDETIRKTYKRFSDKFGLSLYVAFDSNFVKRLGVHGFPFYIWLDENGIVRWITNAGSITRENLVLFASGKAIRNGSIERIKFDAAEPFLVDGNGGNDTNYLYRSVLVKWDPAKAFYRPSFIDYDKRPQSIQILCATLADLYNFAFHGETKWNDKHPKYGRYYPVPLIIPDMTGAVQANQTTYCYSLWTSPIQQVHTGIRQLFLQDLENNFGYFAGLEQRMMPCYRIKIRDGFEKLLRSASQAKKSEVTHAGFTFKRKPTRLLVSVLARYFPDGPPFIDDTPPDFLMDLEINAILPDFEDFRQKLFEKGIELVPAERLMSVIVLHRKAVNVAAN